MPDPRLLFLRDAWQAASQAAHIFPDYAACEAALESGFGQSQLSQLDKNLFGTKQHRHHVYGTHSLPTREFLHGEWAVVNQDFVSYPSWRECFLDRMITLNRLAAVYPHYKAALDAANGETFVREVSMTWSTDPKRAEKVLDIYSQRMSLVKELPHEEVSPAVDSGNSV